jgi:PAS domain S-box-containing protein
MNAPPQKSFRSFSSGSPSARVSWSQDRFLRAFIIAPIGLTLLTLLLYMVWGPGPVLAEIPWVTPMINTFGTLTTLSVAFLAFGRSRAMRDPLPLWVGMGFAAFGIGQGFYVLTWPGLLPGGGSIIGHLTNTPAVITELSLILFGACLLVAALQRGPGYLRLGRPWWWSVIGWLVWVPLLFILLIAFEQFLPVLVKNNGVFTSVMRISVAVLLLLFLAGSILSIRAYHQSRDALAGYVAFAQMAMVFVLVMNLIGEKRYDAWWYLQRVVLVSGGVVVLLGLLSEYVHLYRREREGQARYRQLTESLPQLIWTSSPEGMCDYLSPQWIQFTGIPEDQQLGFGWLEQIHPQDRDRTVEAWAQTRISGELFSIEFRVHRRDGEYRWFKTLAVPLQDGSGRIYKWFGSCTDIHDQTQLAEEREGLFLENQRQKALLDGIFKADPSGLAVLVGPELHHAYVNPAYRYILPGLEINPLGKPYRAIWPAETINAYPEQIEQVLETGKPFLRNHIVHHYSDGGQLYFTLQARRMDWGGQPAVLLILWNVTELELAEQALRESEQRYRSAGTSDSPPPGR